MGQINGANAFQCFSKDGKFNSKTQKLKPYMYTVRSHVSKPSTSLPIFSIMSICESTRKNVNSTVQMLFSLISLQSFNLRTRSSGRTKSTVRFLNPHSNGTTIFTRVI